MDAFRKREKNEKPYQPDSDPNNLMSSFSHYGANYVDVAAPGTAILSTSIDGKWQSMSGTSMAAPIVAGAVARGLSAGYSAAEAVSRLIDTCDRNATVWSGKTQSLGVINLIEYLKY